MSEEKLEKDESAVSLAEMHEEMQEKKLKEAVIQKNLDKEAAKRVDC